MAEGFPDNKLALRSHKELASTPRNPNTSFFEKLKTPFYKIFEENKEKFNKQGALSTSTPQISVRRKHSSITRHEDMNRISQETNDDEWKLKSRHNDTSEVVIKQRKEAIKDKNSSSESDEESYEETPKWLTLAEEKIKHNNTFLTSQGITKPPKIDKKNEAPQVDVNANDEFLPIRQPVYPIIPQRKTVKNSEFLSAMSHIMTFSGDNEQDVRKFVRNVEEVREMLELENKKVLQILKFKTDKEARTFISTAEVMYGGDADTILGALRQKYEPTANINSLQMRLTSIKMKKGESIRKFKSRIEKINSEIIEIDWDAAPTESLLISIFVKALPKYTRQLLMDSGKQSWDAITARAERLEDENEEKEESKVIEVCKIEKEESKEPTKSIEELAIQALERKTAYQESQATCTNCHKKGHVAYKCPAPRQNKTLDLTGFTPQMAKKVLYFCSYCGSGQHLIEDCPLEKENRLRNPSIYSTRYEPTEEYMLAKQNQLCYACGGVGHYANECPTRLKLEYSQQSQGYNSMAPQFNTIFNPRGKGRGRRRGFGNRGNNNGWNNNWNNNWNNGNNNNNWGNNNWNNSNRGWNRGNRRPSRGNNFRGRRNPGQQNPNQTPPGNQLALPAPPTNSSSNQGN